MKTISDFTIHCTTEQIRQALELGAPIIADTREIKFAKPNGLPFDVDRVVIPTAEQMIGWLESQEAIRSVEVTESFMWHYRVRRNKHDDTEDWIQGARKTRPEATLAAIDAALGFLKDN